MLELFEPHIEDLWFKEKILSDEQTIGINKKKTEFPFIFLF